MILLQVSGLAKSVYYYTLSKIDKDDKNKEIIDKIKQSIEVDIHLVQKYIAVIIMKSFIVEDNANQVMK